MTKCRVCGRASYLDHSICEQFINIVNEYDEQPLVMDQGTVDHIAQRQKAQERLWHSYRQQPPESGKYHGA